MRPHAAPTDAIPPSGLTTGETGAVIRLLIADDEAMVRKGLRLVLETEDDLQVIGEAADGLEAIEETRRLHPDVVLMEVRMPRLDGVEACRRIVEDSDAKVVRWPERYVDERGAVMWETVGRLIDKGAQPLGVA